MHVATVEAVVTVKLAWLTVTVRVPARLQPVPEMLAVPTPGLNRKPAGAFRIVVVPRARKPAAPSAIVGPVSVV